MCFLSIIFTTIPRLKKCHVIPRKQLYCPDEIGTRGSYDENERKEKYLARLNELGEVKYCRIEVKPKWSSKKELFSFFCSSNMFSMIVIMID
jgi:hypothetical protein